ncbi:MAG: [citrate (pro-3S)-lyase] ligase [Bacteroidota bacterium]|nr:[citrate (pro-3S)-lyase] ligase [Bacteroidota bacterium]
MDTSTQEFSIFHIEIMDLEIALDEKLISDFTTKYNICFDKTSVDYTIGLFNEKSQLIGTGSSSGNILKYIVVEEEYRVSNAFAQITTHLTDYVLEYHEDISVYTHPKNIMLFEGLGFKLVEKALPLFCMLEFGVSSINNYVEYLKKIKSTKEHKRTSSIVVNCNPFTKGHLYLIEKAAAENDLLYLFVVQENLSVFPFEIRWELIKKGISHLDNVIMVKGGNYIVSGATFPSYFLKSSKSSAIIENQAELDIRIFSKYIVPTLGINLRYIGTETYCNTTNAYNKAMHKLLPTKNVEVKEIERVCIDNKESNNYISASKIRDAIKHDCLEDMFDSLPDSTKDFLLSDAAQPIIEKIKQSKGRH